MYKDNEGRGRAQCQRGMCCPELGVRKPRCVTTRKEIFNKRFRHNWRETGKGEILSISNSILEMEVSFKMTKHTHVHTHFLAKKMNTKKRDNWMGGTIS